MAFGSDLHELVLEPNTKADWPDTVDRKLIETLATQIQADSFCRWVLQFSRKESVQLWEDPITGLLLKSKLEMVHKNRLVIDLKSTSQRTHASTPTIMTGRLRFISTASTLSGFCVSAFRI